MKKTGTLVVFGATGDLMSRKIAPSLFHLFEKDELSESFSVVGVARRDLKDEGFRSFIKESITNHLGQANPSVDKFMECFRYHQGLFENKRDYESLNQLLAKIDEERKSCADKLFYLAVPPQHYATILKSLASSGLTDACNSEDGWTRVLVEKPFGKDIVEAQALDKLLSALFKEEQVYRIDHYLAKEVLQNILMFRFANNLLEGVWNNKHIERIEVKLLEEIGVENRGSFYDGTGALLDVGQNHILQMMALVTMDHPVTMSASTIKSKKEAVLRQARVLRPAEIAEDTFRGQYDGYEEEAGVKSGSQTETYFKIKTYIESPRWAGVPIFLEAGKKMAAARKEVAVIFKHPAPCICPVGQSHFRNRVRFRIEPDPGISIQFWSKKPGIKQELEDQLLDFKYQDMGSKHYMEEYQKVLLDCIAGDQTIFSSSEESMAGWGFIDPIVDAWKKNVVPLHKYSQDAGVLKKAESVGMKVSEHELKREIGVVGLGKMGANLARQLIDQSWSVAGYNRSSKTTTEMESEGLIGAYSIKELVEKLTKPRVVWLMVPAGKPLDAVLFDGEGLVKHLDKGDIIIDGGNSFYKDTRERAEKLKQYDLKFIDVGVSGGPAGARWGACLMVGGDQSTFEHLTRLFTDLAVSEGVRFFEGTGAGHFVKMVHNGIEYGMMQSIAEGFSVLSESDYGVDLLGAADVYNHGSVIESNLMGWLRNAFIADGPDLKGVSGVVGHTGEAEWTAKAAAELHVKTKVIEESLQARIDSAEHPNFAGQILTALRDQFGGHGKGKKAN